MHREKVNTNYIKWATLMSNLAYSEHDKSPVRGIGNEFSLL